MTFFLRFFYLKKKVFTRTSPKIQAKTTRFCRKSSANQNLIYCLLCFALRFRPAAIVPCFFFTFPSSFSFFLSFSLFSPMQSWHWWSLCRYLPGQHAVMHLMAILVRENKFWLAAGQRVTSSWVSLGWRQRALWWQRAVPCRHVWGI